MSARFEEKASWHALAARGSSSTLVRALPSPSFPLPLRREREASRAARCASGFTLIEVAVVMLLLVILLGMAGMRLTRDRGDIIRDEARRLVIALHGAQQQAILEGRPYAFAVTRDGYQFLRVDAKGKLGAVGGDDALRPHALPYPLKLESSTLRAETDKRPDIIFDTTGDFGTFVLTLQFDEIRWYIEGDSDGEIRASGTREPTAT